MTIYFAGGEMGAFIPSDTTVSESGGGYDSNFARSALYATRDPNYYESPSIANLTTAWVHFDLKFGFEGYGSQSERFTWYNNSGVAKVRLFASNSGDVAMQYHNGTTWVTAGSAITTLMSSRQTIDIGVVCNSASGSIRLYLAGTERITATGLDLSGITELNKIRFTGETAGGSLGADTNASQVIVADEPTIGMRVMTVPMTGTGANTAWTASYDSVDEKVYNDVDFIFSDTAGQVETYTGTPIGSITGYRVRGVAITARARCGAGGPQNIQLALRSGGTDYFSATKALSVGYGAFVNVWNTDPDTTLTWASSAISTLQYGVKSIA